jgi:HEAT repeat protein
MRFSILSFLGAVVVVTVVLSSRAQQDKKEAKFVTQSTGTVIGGKTLYQWIQEIKDKDPSIQENAIATVKLYGQNGRVAAPALISELSDRDVSLRVNAAITLGIVGMEEKDLPSGVNGLIRLLNDSQTIVRYQAAMAIGRLGTDGRAAIPALLGTLKDTSSWEIRKAAAFAIGAVADDRQHGPDIRAMKGLAAALNDSCFQVRLEAILALTLLGPPLTANDKQAIIQSLKNAIPDRNKIVSIWARVGQMRMDNDITETHLTAIAKHLKAPELSPRVHAARALGTIGPQAKSRVPDLMASLDDNDPLVVVWSAWSLGFMGNAAAKAIPKLESLKQHRDEGVQRAAAEALDRIGVRPSK